MFSSCDSREVIVAMDNDARARTRIHNDAVISDIPETARV